MATATYSASDLIHRVEFYVKTRIVDPGGGASTSFGPTSPPTRAYSAVIPQRAFERYEFGQTTSNERILVVIRYRRDISAEMRIAYGDRVLAILAVIDVDERHEWLEIDCEEQRAP